MTKLTWFRFRPDAGDLIAVLAFYLATVGVFRLAFAGFGTEREIALFVTFAVFGLLLLGVAAPLVYMVWVRRRTLGDLGIGRRLWKQSLALGLALGGIQYVMTFGATGVSLPPQPVDWVPLLVMSLVVGFFEAVFFRGFIQNRLEASFGIVPAIIGAAGLYSWYHVGYMMGANEMLFLFGLGIGFAIVFRLTRNILVLWPFVTPVGSFFNNLQAGDIQLPWLSILGFGEVLVAMFVVVFIAYRYQVRRARVQKRPTRIPAGVR